MAYDCLPVLESMKETNQGGFSNMLALDRATHWDLELCGDATSQLHVYHQLLSLSTIFCDIGVGAVVDS